MTAITTTPAPAAAPARPTASRWRTLGALLARDLRVIRRDVLAFAVRSVIQPALFVFVFTYVMPRIGAQGGSTPFSSGSGGGAQQTFSTILVPGLVATAIVVQGLLAVTAPLMMELSYTREIEDRVLAPVSAATLGIEKIIVGTAQALVAGVVVFPFVLFVHASGQAPQLDFADWPLLVLVLLLAAGFTSAFGMFLAMFIDPRKLSTMFAIIVVPMTMLGCVYYPWAEPRARALAAVGRARQPAGLLQRGAAGGAHARRSAHAAMDLDARAQRRVARDARGGVAGLRAAGHHLTCHRRLTTRPRRRRAASRQRGRAGNR